MKQPEDVAIRPIRGDDVAGLHALRLQPEVMRGTLNLPSTTLESVRARVEAGAADPGVHAFVAETGGLVVGYGALRTGTGRRARTADLVLFVHDSHAGRGIGRALLERLLELADDWLDLVRVELEVYTDNARAIRLYESAGFAREGTKRAYAFREGSWADVHVMGRVRGEAMR